MKNNINNMPEAGYVSLLDDIKKRITSARIKASQSVNKELIQLYWDIGKMIVLRQKKYAWGNSIVEKLAKDLEDEYPDNVGCSSRNLWDMRRFYQAYKDFPILRQLVAEIPWGQNIIIFSRIKDVKEREYYLKATAEMGWSRNVLIHQICLSSALVGRNANLASRGF